MDSSRSMPASSMSKIEPRIQKDVPVGRFRRLVEQKENQSGFYLVMAYVTFEFGRPQDIIPGLGVIPFTGGLSLLLAAKVVMSGKVSFSHLQTKLWIALLGVMAIHVPIAANNFWALM